MSETADMELKEYNIEAITGGPDSLAEVFVIMGDKNGNNAIGRSAADDIVLASLEAVLYAINRILLGR
ncbi:MAG: 2-isopropylmalate synthase [Methanobacterium sp. PtaU1.Bin097]|nr:MAG: 2-isopropylmalate synthase [Methanobacterium sp. PtaU1.Bin097]